MPVVEDELGGYLLHPVDLATNKMLGPGRQGRASGFRRRRPGELARLDTVESLDPVRTKERWLAGLEEAETFVHARPPDEVGCLYYSTAQERFVAPEAGIPLEDQGLVLHFGRMGGVLPRPVEQELERKE